MNHHHPSQVTFSIHTCTCTHPTIDLISPHAFRSHSRFLISVSSFVFLSVYIYHLFVHFPPHTPDPHLTHFPIPNHHQLPPSNHPPYSRAFELLKIRQLISNHLGAQSKKEEPRERKKERKGPNTTRDVWQTQRERERERERGTLCVCVRKRERERERKGVYVCEDLCV